MNPAQDSRRSGLLWSSLELCCWHKGMSVLKYALIYTQTDECTVCTSEIKVYQETNGCNSLVKICSGDLTCSSQVDKDFIPGLMYIRDNEATAEEFEAMTLPFTVPNASGQDIQLSSKYSHITLENRAEYVRLAINYR